MSLKLKHLYPDTVSVVRITETLNEIAVPEESESTILTGVKSRIYWKRGQIQIGESGAMETYDYRMVFETSGVQATDIIVYGDKRLLVLRIQPIRTKKKSHHYEAFLREVYE